MDITEKSHKFVTTSEDPEALKKLNKKKQKDKAAAYTDQETAVSEIHRHKITAKNAYNIMCESPMWRKHASLVSDKIFEMLVAGEIDHGKSNQENILEAYQTLKQQKLIKG